MNVHKNARLTFARRLEMVRQITQEQRSVAAAAAGAAARDAAADVVTALRDWLDSSSRLSEYITIRSDAEMKFARAHAPPVRGPLTLLDPELPKRRPAALDERLRAAGTAAVQKHLRKCRETSR